MEIRKEILAEAIKINEFLRNSGIKEETKGYLVSAIILVLSNNEDINKKMFLDEKTDDKGFGEILYEKLEISLNKLIKSEEIGVDEVLKLIDSGLTKEEINERQKIFKENKKTKEVMLNSFTFLKTLTALKQVINTEDESTLIIPKLIEDIKTNVIEKIKSDKNLDLLGIFYQEFTKYNSGDGNGLGIVLTPTHVCEIMAEIIDLEPTDTVLDLCTGSTSLLMACLNNIKEKDKNNEFDVSKNLIGIEFSDQLFTMAMINLLIREKDQTKIKVPRLISGSCFDKNFTGENEKPQPTKLIINPPYSQCKTKEQKDLHELNFLKHGLEQLVPGGKGAAIFPTSCFTKNDFVSKGFKKELLDSNTLEAVITMSDQLFYPVGTCTVISLWTAGVAHPKDKEVKLYNFKDDGFEIDRKEGMKCLDKKETETKTKELVEYIKNGTSVMNKSTESIINKEDEWVYESFRSTDKATEEDFLAGIKDRLMYEFSKNLNI